MLINVKMPTTISRRINKTSESFKARKVFICYHTTFFEQLKFMLSCVEHEKSFITSGPGRVSYCARLLSSIRTIIYQYILRSGRNHVIMKSSIAYM